MILQCLTVALGLRKHFLEKAGFKLGLIGYVRFQQENPSVRGSLGQWNSLSKT